MAGRQFVGKHDNKLDSKSRMSIPADFRTILKEIGAQRLMLRPSLRFPSIEVFPDVYFAEYEARLEARDVFSDDHSDMLWDTYSDVTNMELDANGRVTLTAELIACAHLASEVRVVGLGKHFEIWDRGRAEARSRERSLRRLAYESGANARSSVSPGAGEALA